MKRQWIIIVENLETLEEEHWQEWLSKDRNEALDEALKLIEQISRERRVNYRLINITDPY